MKLPFITYLIPYLFHLVLVFLHMTRINKNKLYLEKPLRDLIFDNSLDLRNLKVFTNILLVIFILPYFQENGIKALSFFFRFFSIIVAIRVVSSTITDIPSSDPNCSINQEATWSSYITGHCFDKIFSGHTAISLSLILIAKKFDLISNKSAIFLSLMQILYVYFFLICTRGHYSVDVFLSYVIVIPLFSCLQNEI